MTESSSKLDTLLFDVSFGRWLSGTASEDEKIRWQEWLEADPENQELCKEAAELWRLGQFQPYPKADLDIELSNLRSRLSQLSEASSTARIISLPRKYKSKSNGTQRRWLPRTAFAIAVAMLAAIVWNLNPFGFLRNANDATKILTTEYGKRAELNLPDGSRVVLNANSQLTYPAKWTSKTKRCFFLIGEAYFDVVSMPEDEQKEFVVESRDGMIKVVGTRFAVYARGSGTRVALEEGLVEVMAVDTVSFKMNREPFLLKPGHILSFKQGAKDFHPKAIDVLPYTSWWQNEFVMNKTPLKEIVKRLEETYGVTVKITDERLLEETVSGSIENYNLAVMTKGLSAVLKIPVRQEGNVIIFGESGTQEN